MLYLAGASLFHSNENKHITMLPYLSKAGKINVLLPETFGPKKGVKPLIKAQHEVRHSISVGINIPESQNAPRAIGREHPASVWLWRHSKPSAFR